MFLPWNNISVTSDQVAINRGIQIAIGTPPQIFSMRPSTADVDLYVANREDCAPSYNDTCEGPYGGVFNPKASSTYRVTTKGHWNGTDDPSLTSLASIYFNDVLSFGNATLDGFPLFLDQPGYGKPYMRPFFWGGGGLVGFLLDGLTGFPGGQGSLPLGWNSVFLKAAVSSGAVPSQAYGLWTGSRSINHPVDGSLVLGGYDSTRFGSESDLITFPSQPDCTGCVQITGLSYDTLNGSTNLFANASETLQVNLQPGSRVLYVTQDIFMRFANATNGTYDSDLENLRYPASDPPTGNLSVTLKNGYKTTIPTEELFVYPRLYNNTGYSISNNTVLIAEVLNHTNNGYIMDWGIPYLTMNYFIADYARSRIQLAPAIRTDFANQGGGYLLQAICDPSEPTSTTTSSKTPTATASATASSAAALGSSKSSDTGAIVGGVVGGVLGLILIVGGLCLLFYRSRRRSGPATPADAENSTSRPHTHSEMSQAGGGLSNRFSNSTVTTPVDVTELSSGKGSMHLRHTPQNQDSEVCVIHLQIVLVLLDHARSHSLCARR
jgi:hypothetical protein